MGQKDFISGSIFEFKVPLGIGYAYCKVLDFRYIREFDGVIVKVFEPIVSQPLKDINSLGGHDLLFGARRMPWLPNSRGKGAWKFKGVLISNDDSIIPDFKYCLKSSPFVEDESKLSPWFVIRNINNSILCSYENVRHLEDTIVSPGIGIEIRTAMEYLRINNLNVSDYFDLNKRGNEITYRQMIRAPIYSSIPKELRGKSIC